MIGNSIDRLFPPQHFNDTPANNVLIHKERAIVMFTRNDKLKEMYTNFDDQFNTYLSKLPNNPIKKYISNIFNKKIIFLGIANTARNDAVFTRVCMTDDKLSALILDSGLLDIDIRTGETTEIDDCIYASYFGFIRAIILANQLKVRNDKDLHKLLSTYIFQIILRAIGARTIYSDRQKSIIHMACVYSFYKHFFNEKHSTVLGIIKKDYSQFFDKDLIQDIIPLFETVTKYNTLQDLPKVLIDLKVFYGQPAQINMSLLTSLGVNYHNFVGPLDTFVAMMVTAKYPTNLISRGAAVNEKLHDAVETILTPYMDDLNYSPSKLFTSIKLSAGEQEKS